MKTLLLLAITAGVLPAPSLRADNTAAPSAYDAIALEDQMKSFFVSVDFTNATIGQVTDTLVDKYKQAGSTQRIQFYVTPEARKTARPITLKLDNVPLGVALHYACELGRLRYKAGSDIVCVYPKETVREDGISVQTFHVDPSFFETH